MWLQLWRTILSTVRGRIKPRTGGTNTSFLSLFDECLDHSNPHYGTWWTVGSVAGKIKESAVESDLIYLLKAARRCWRGEPKTRRLVRPTWFFIRSFCSPWKTKLDVWPPEAVPTYYIHRLYSHCWYMKPKSRLHMLVSLSWNFACCFYLNILEKSSSCPFLSCDGKLTL